MALEQRVTTAPTFADGNLYPAGAVITIDTDLIEVREPDTLAPGDPGNMTNLAPVGTFPVTASGPVGANEVVTGELDAMRAQLAKMEALLAGLGIAPVAPEPSSSDGLVEEQAQSALFDAGPIVAGTVPDVIAALEGLNAEELAAVAKAEQDRETPRAGVVTAVEAALAAKK